MLCYINNYWRSRVALFKLSALYVTCHFCTFVELLCYVTFCTTNTLQQTTNDKTITTNNKQQELRNDKYSIDIINYKNNFN